MRAGFRGDLASFAWFPGASPRVAREWEVKPLGVPFDGTELVRSGPFPIAPASTVTLDGLVGGLDPGTAYAWRARFVTDHPLFPATRWFSAAGNCPLEAKLRTPPNASSRLLRDPLPRSQP